VVLWECIESTKKYETYSTSKNLPNGMTKTKLTLIAFPEASLIADFCFQFQDNGLDIDVDVIHPDDFFALATPADCDYIVGVTRDLDLRKKIIAHMDSIGCHKFTFVHCSAKIERNAEVGAGSFVGPFSLVASGAVLEQDCLLAPYSMISHRARVGQGTIIHPGVIVAGTAQIGRNCRLNVRSTVLDHVTVGDDIEIGAGAVVTKNLAEPAKYVGTPARKVSTQ
jgi:UDP-3-O-[3-hydroxymyristoyl] glucosamine N-acyltransferase